MTSNKIDYSTLPITGGWDIVENYDNVNKSYSVKQFEFPLTGWFVVDVEVHTPKGANPTAFDTEAKCLLVGEMYRHASQINQRIYTREQALIIGSTHEDEVPRVMVGHNLKFDIHWMRRLELRISGKADDGSQESYDVDEWLAKNIIWDTMIAEYILSGQGASMPSLAYCCEKRDILKKYGYGKGDLLTNHFKNGGYSIMQLPPQEVINYLGDDLASTFFVAKEQIEEAQKRGMLRLCLAQMGAALAVQDMEWNGLSFDLKYAADLLENLTKEQEKIRLVVKHKLQAIFPEMDLLASEHFSISSNKDVAAYLFGGERSWDIKVPYATKMGKIRNKKLTVSHTFRPQVDCKDEWKTPGGDPSVADDVLAELKGFALVDDIREYRTISKISSTYCVGLASKAVHVGGKGVVIHHTLNQALTATGRLSSSNPNMQNIPSFDKYGVKKMFKSRFHNGVIVDADFKQIEIVALAYLSKCPILCDDIINGKDIHTETGKGVFGHAMTKEERRIVKTINFGLIYGGGPHTLAAQAGVSLAVAQSGIAAFKARYTGVADWFEQMRDAVNNEVESKGELFGHSNGGFPMRRKSIRMLPTARHFVFEQTDAPKYQSAYQSVYKKQHVNVNVKPSVIRNYPVQGFATGDIVPMVFSYVWRRLYEEKLAVLMINTVHDSIMFDCANEIAAKRCAQIVKQAIENTPALLNKFFGIKDFDLPVRCEITAGPNWGTQQEFDV